MSYDALVRQYATTTTLQAHLASILIIRLTRVPGNNSSLHSLGIAPAVISQLRLPSPEDPSFLLLIRHNLRRPPLSIEVAVSAIRDLEGGTPLHAVGRANAPFADNEGSVTIAGHAVAAGCGEVSNLGCCDRCVPLQVAMIVISSEVLVGEAGFWVASTPVRIHELDVKVIVCTDAEGGFGFADLRIGGGVIFGNETGLPGDGLVENFDHADVAIVVVCVDAVSHELEELVGAGVLIGLVKPSGWGILNVKLVFVQPHNL